MFMIRHTSWLAEATGFIYTIQNYIVLYLDTQTYGIHTHLLSHPLTFLKAGKAAGV